MDTAEIVVMGGGVLLFGFILWFFFGGRDGGADKPQVADGSVIYACPMHPWITSTDPAANCSVCGMKLVKAD